MRADSVEPNPAIGSSSSSNLRFGGERYREFKLALLAMAQFGHHDIGAALEANARQRRQRRFAQMFFLAGIAPEIKRVAVMRLRRQRDIVQRGEIAAATR